jgi:class 3 adenylate cyclase
MAKLSATDRARLPNSAFAYIDSKGGRRLPINDEAHVRNALARFGRMAFEDDAARERARKRLLNAAKKYGIVPVGFITGQLQQERRGGTALRKLPTGFVTFLLTDIEGSTALLRRLGDRYAGLLDGVRDVIQKAAVRGKGKEVDTRADEVFAVFQDAGAAVEAAVAIQRTLAKRKWPDDLECRVRIGLHSGRPTLTESGYIGLSVHTAARVCSAAHGGQIMVTGKTKAALRGAVPAGIRFEGLGSHQLPGLAMTESLWQVVAEGLDTDFPPPRIAAPRP